jgi:hypothetical protein
MGFGVRLVSNTFPIGTRKQLKQNLPVCRLPALAVFGGLFAFRVAAPILARGRLPLNGICGRGKTELSCSSYRTSS